MIKFQLLLYTPQVQHTTIKWWLRAPPIRSVKLQKAQNLTLILRALKSW